MTARLRALRGATTVEADDAPSVRAAVLELLGALAATNGLAAHELVSVLFSATPDVRALDPDGHVRDAGWADAPTLAVREIDVPGAPAKVVRVLLHLLLPGDRVLHPAYLRGAAVLRPDLVARP